MAKPSVLPPVDTKKEAPHLVIGNILHAARKKRSISLVTTAKDLHIPERYLTALEAGTWDLLPGEVYARGYLRSYAEYLGLNHADLIRKFEAKPVPVQPIRTPRLHQYEPQFNLRPLLIWGCVVSVAALVGVMVAKTQLENSVSTVRPVPASLVHYLGHDTPPFYRYSCMAETDVLWSCYFTAYVRDPYLHLR